MTPVITLSTQEVQQLLGNLRKTKSLIKMVNQAQLVTPLKAKA
jgi:hypothetical protein